MKIDLNFILKGLDGKELTGGTMPQVHAGMLLGNLIASTNKSSDILKWMGWAQTLYAQKALEVSENEKREIVEFIQKSESLTILAKHQLIESIEGKVKSLKTEKAA